MFRSINLRYLALRRLQARSRDPRVIWPQLKTVNLELLYTIFCDDVRLEVGNKLSFMGVFQNIMVQQLPVSLIKFAVVNHWRGEGSHLSEVRILSPDRQHPVVVSQPTSFEIPGRLCRQHQFLC